MTFLERRQRVLDTAGTLLFLEVTAASFSEPMRIVNDTQNWTSNSVEYIGVPFGFQFPDDNKAASRAVLVMTNVGRGITQELESLQPNEVVMARLMLSDRANPNTIERTYFLPMTHVSVNGTTATAQCGNDFLMRQQAVRLRCTPYTLPGDFG